ncbi:protein-tyrosine-phosphatase [Halobacteriovorax marinus]|uniref:Low molecular weight protein-tyrosine-phosphatase n=1 Tax=Halobacteriovorax marinus (strain ATCC BAA-682 / DSM 15412 / SJ) TaxID=862908 RepID=E1WY26_HALMS|nr:low molecular weight protein-tyrosine-phosphatase [Halobacteriovorax marinus]ATH08877.1 protein-tyrosine-phosphatase [Halobacteriovorax marinus]CBW27581.1 putative low molecular weight protein-tyrosine-phosphatase [Halobacteriovorax marinus SJ]
MKKVLFVCLGNICRSPMAEGILSSYIEKLNLNMSCDSAGTSAFHEGEMADARMREAASRRGYNLSQIRSRGFRQEDFQDFDSILVMDQSNYKNITRLAASDDDFNKVKLITDYCTTMRASEVPDPYYGGDQGFFEVIDILEDAIKGFIAER